MYIFVTIYSTKMCVAREGSGQCRIRRDFFFLYIYIQNDLTLREICIRTTKKKRYQSMCFYEFFIINCQWIWIKQSLFARSYLCKLLVLTFYIGCCCLKECDNVRCRSVIVMLICTRFLLERFSSLSLFATENPTIQHALKSPIYTIKANIYSFSHIL